MFFFLGLSFVKNIYISCQCQQSKEMDPPLLNLPLRPPAPAARLPLQTVKKDGTKRVTKSDCRQLLENAPRTVVALYSNPRIPQSLASMLQPLNALTREMRVLISQLSPFDFFISPATTKGAVATLLAHYKPRVLIISGHTLNGALVFENETGRLDPNELMTKIEFEDMISSAPSLELVCLMACKSDTMLPSTTRNGIRFISWSSVAEDNAAFAFTSGVISELASQLRGGELSSEGVFSAGVAAFERGGFVIGDPLDKIAKSPLPHGVPVLT